MRFALLLLLLQLAAATHFAFGTTTFRRKIATDDTQCTFRAESAWRWSFPTWLQRNGNRRPAVGDRFFPGFTCFVRPIGTRQDEITPGFYANVPSSITCATTSTYQMINIRMDTYTVTFVFRDPSFTGPVDQDILSYFNGVWTFDITLTSTDATYKGFWWAHFHDCCRVSTVLNGNNDGAYIITSRINLKTNRVGTSTAGLFREFAQIGVPWIFTLPVSFGQDALGLTFAPNVNDLKFELPASHHTGLRNPRPFNPITGVTAPANDYLNSSCRPTINDCVTLDQRTGAINWIPKNFGLYALQINILDAPANRIASLMTPIDFIVEVVADCNPNCAPYFLPRQPTLPDQCDSGERATCRCSVERGTCFENSRKGNPCNDATLLTCRTKTVQAFFFKNIESFFYIVATDDNSTSLTTVQSNSLLPGMVFSLVSVVNSTSWYTMTWTPSLSDVSFDVCFTAVDQQNKNSFNKYCLKMEIKVGNILFVSGILRDFLSTHPDFNVTVPTQNPQNIYVNPQLPANGQIALALGSVPGRNGVPNRFDQWFTDVTGVNSAVVFSRTLTDVFNDGSFTFSTSQLFPIDGILLGNEGKPHNLWFTWEVLTFVTFNTSVQDLNLVFSAVDDLFVYIDFKLAVALPGPRNPNNNPPVVFDFRLFGNTFLQNGATVRCDIFYAHRGATSNPGLTLTLPANALCNALTPLGSFVEFDFDLRPVANPQATVLLQFNSLRSGFGTLGFEILQRQVFGAGTATWYAAPVVGSTTVSAKKVQILQGFQLDFSFVTTNGALAEGFAWVMQSQGPGDTAVGSAGPGLGYDSVLKALVAEFDMQGTLAVDGADFVGRQHVAVQQGGVTQGVSSRHGLGVPDQVAISNPLDPVMTLNNNTVHNVVITYTPPQDADRDRQGFMRVFMNTILAPVVEAELDAVDLRNLFGGAAFVGFTAGGGAQPNVTISITKMKLQIVTISGVFTNLVETSPPQTPKTVVAGENWNVDVQARDACGVKLLVSSDLEALRFQATLRKEFAGTVIATGNITSNGDGTYRVLFPGSATIAGPMLLSITFRESSGSVTSIAGSPFKIQVNPGITDPTRTFLFLGELPVTQNQPIRGDTSSSGLLIADFSSTGKVRFTDISNDINTINTMLTGLGTHYCVAVRGDAPIAFARHPKLTACARNYTTFGSYACCVSPCGNLPGRADPADFSVHNVNCRDFTLVAESAGANFGPGLAFANVNSLRQNSNTSNPWIIAANDNLGASFAIVVRDQFDNLQITADFFEVVFVPPSINFLEPDLVFGNAFQRVPWDTTVALDYTVTVRFTGNTNRPDNACGNSPQPIRVLSGLPSPARSTVLGDSASVGIAGVTGTFDLVLQDEFGNTVNANPFTPIAVVTGQLLLPGSPAVNLTFTFNPVTFRATASYFTTKSGTYELSLFVTNGNRLEFTQTINFPTIILAGDLFAPRCEIFTSPGVALQTSIRAGELQRVFVQARDQFGNARLGSNPRGDFLPIFTPSTSVRDVVVGFEGEGIYAIEYTGKVTGSVTLKIAESARNTTLLVNTLANLTTPPQPINGYAITIRHGVPSSLSTLQSVPPTLVAGQTGSVRVLAIDTEGNSCNVDPFPELILGSMTGVTTSFLGSTATTRGGAACTGQPANCYTITVRATAATQYAVSVLASGASIVNSPGLVTVLPAAPNCANSQFDQTGVRGFSGGVALQPTSFVILIRDIFGNSVLENSTVVPNQLSFTLTINGTATALAPSPTKVIKAGTFLGVNVSYTVPADTTQTGTTYIGLLTKLGAAWDTDPTACPSMNIFAFTGGANQVFVVLDANTATTTFEPLASDDAISVAVAGSVHQVCWFQFASFTNPVLALVQASSFTLNLNCISSECTGSTANVLAIFANTRWCADFNLAKSGTYQMTILANGFSEAFIGRVSSTLADRTSVNQTVIPGEVDPPSCEVGLGLVNSPFPQAVLPLLTAVAGETIRFPVILRDRGLNLVALSNNIIRLSARMVENSGTCGNNCASFDAIFDAINARGQFVANFVGVNKASSYTVTAFFNGLELGFPSSSTIRVNPAQPNAPSSLLTSAASPANLAANIIEIEALPIASQTHECVINVRDVFGNANPDPALTITAPALLAVSPFTVTYLGNAKYAIRFAAQRSNTTVVDFTFAGSFRGVPFTSSALTARVRVMPRQPTQATFSPAVFVGTAGQAATYEVTFLDEFGNPWLDRVSTVFGSAISPDGPTRSAIASQPSVRIEPPFTGKFSFTLSGNQVTKAGNYTWSWIVNGLAFASQYSYRIDPGLPDAAPIQFLSSWTRGQVDVSQSINVQLTDQFSNKITSGYDASFFKVSFLKEAIISCDTSFTAPGSNDAITPYTELARANSSEVLIGVTDNQNGQFTITARPFLRSPPPFATLIEYNDGFTNTTINCPTAQRNFLFVNPGVPNGPTSEALDVQPSYVAGISFRFTVILRDSRSNLVGLGGDARLIRSNITGCTETVLDLLSGSYTVLMTCTKAGVHGFVLNVGSTGSVPIVSLVDGQSTITILPGAPSSFRMLTPDETGSSSVAGERSVFRFVVSDSFGNLVTDLSDLSFSASFVQFFAGTVQVKYSETNPSFTANAQGQFEFAFTSIWNGTFTVQAVLFVNGVSVTSSIQSFEFLPATCGARNAALPFQCPGTQRCVATYADCSVLCASNTVQCSDGQCRNTCPCPSGQLNCPDTGLCVLDLADCGVTNCPAQTTRCPNSTQCRTASTFLAGTSPNCPSVSNCPPGYTVCASGQCVLTAQECAPLPDCTGAFPVVCPTGQCVANAQDCPTPVTCPVSFSVCPDGSCAQSNCPSLFPCAQGEIRCFDGSCRPSLAACGTPVTCLVGQVKCESGHCADTLDACTIPISCGVEQVRCPDNSCALNPLLCSTAQACPETSPVLCPDRACVQTVDLCVGLQVCTLNGATFTCPDGSCVAPGTPCPTGRQCPTDFPVLCQDGQCVTSSIQCDVIDACPSGQRKCPTGFCANNLYDCPSGVACSGEQPVKCPDGQCAASQDNCRVPTELLCPADLVKCPGGECALALTLCPTSITCPATHTRCIDGTCRTSCLGLIVPSCLSNQVTCPNGGTGVICASSFAACPTAAVCPSSLVRCLDNTCAGSVTACPPPPPDADYDNLQVCPGNFFVDSVATCPTLTTCPPTAPIKCLDDTCRLAPADCPVPAPCPVNLPYRCLSGDCVASLTDSACAPAAPACPELTPIRCPVPPLGSTISCVADLTQCVDPFDTNVASEPCTSNGFFQCRDGTCAFQGSNCPAFRCPSTSPFLCPDGACTSSQSLCLDPLTGCRFDQTKCPGTGGCIEGTDDKLCPNAPSCPLRNGEIRCADGSCSLPADCPGANGCPRGEFRCFDGSCVTLLATCTERFDENGLGFLANVCPPFVPFLCDGGFCSVSSTACPVLKQTCPVNTVPCANGSCQVSKERCPIVTPCADSQFRCPDGFCHELEFVTTVQVGDACPTFSLCSGATPFMCQSGLCASGVDACLETGCPLGTRKCDSGLCVAADAVCLAIPPNDGCVTPLTKCANGACRIGSECDALNGCPFDKPLRCAIDQSCASNITACPNTDPCVNVAAAQRCADGSCAVPCLAANGCPVTAPIRCIDGTCAQHDSTFVGDGTKCSVQVGVCVAGVPCADGSCVDTTSFCPPVQTPFSGTNCPSSRAIQCQNGACVDRASQCSSTATGTVVSLAGTGTGSTGGGVNIQNQDQLVLAGGCAGVVCADGGCRANAAACINFAQSNGVSCSPPFVFCANGACVADGRTCQIIPACPVLTVRCPDGTCTSGSCPSVSTCPPGQTRCECGTCRTECLRFDGCPLSAPFHCRNRECGKNENDCDPQTKFVYTGSAVVSRRLLQSDDPAVCGTNCNAQARPLDLTLTVSSFSALTVQIAFDILNVPVGELRFPAGSVRPDGTIPDQTLHTVTIGPVADSRLRDSQNALHPTRIREFGQTDLTYPQTLLSTAFECFVGNGTASTFGVPITYAATMDRTIKPANEDVCLARLVRIDALQYSRWECLVSDATKRRPGPAISDSTLQLVEGTFDVCGKTLSDGSIYAFIHAPLVREVGSPFFQRDFFLEFLPYIILVILTLVLIILGSLFFGKRLHRYREKYKHAQIRVDQLQEEVNTMEQFGGTQGNKDEEVQYTTNPLVTQLKDLQTKMDANEIALAQEKAVDAAKEAKTRAEVIEKLENDRDDLYHQLKALKEQLESMQNAPVVLNQREEDTNTTTGATVASVAALPGQQPAAAARQPTKNQAAFKAGPARKKQL